MRAVIIIFGFSFIFNYLFSIQSLLAWFNLLPKDFFQHPQDSFSQYKLIACKFTLGWIIPIVISAIFVIKAQIHKRLTVNYGFILIAISVVIILARQIILYLTTFIQGGGATFVSAYLFGYFYLPIKLMLVIGAVKLLITLKPLELS